MGGRAMKLELLSYTERDGYVKSKTLTNIIFIFQIKAKIFGTFLQKHSICG